MEWKWTVPTINGDPPVTINDSAVDDSLPSTEGPAPDNPPSIDAPEVDNGPRPIGSLVAYGSSQLSKSGFLPCLSETPRRNQTDIATRFQGWFRNGGSGKNILLQYGLKENPLIEIVPGGAIGNLTLSKLINCETLKEKWEKWDRLGPSLWDDDMQITNVAKSGSVRLWVCINNSIWVTRTNLENFQIGNGMKLGKQSAMDCIMECVEDKADWYRATGYPDEADQYLDQFLEFFEN